MHRRIGCKGVGVQQCASRCLFVPGINRCFDRRLSNRDEEVMLHFFETIQHIESRPHMHACQAADKNGSSPIHCTFCAGLESGLIRCQCQ